MNSDITIRDVAEATGFSVNTVSRALNEKPDVSAETKRVILESVGKLGYRPNKHAPALRGTKTQTIGVIVADISNPFFAAVVKGVEQAARQRNWSIILGNTDEKYEKEEEVIRTMLAERVDGLLLAPTQTNKGTIMDLKASGFPFVLLGRHFDDLDTDYVVTDDVQGGFLATEHLISLGRERIAMINGPLHISSAKERFQGYKKALEHYGIRLDRSIVKGGAITTDDGYEISKALLNHEPCLTGIFAYSDFVAFGAMRAIREAGLNIPDDIAIIGYDDVEFSSCLEVPLTTIEIPEQKLGSNAVSILDERIRDRKKDALRSILEVKLIIRASTTQMPHYPMQRISTGR